MAFVNEEIQEKDKEYFNSFNLKSPFTNNKLIEPWEWTIDRERDAFLVALGGQGTYNSEIPMFYALVWGKNIILLETFSNSKGNYSTGVETWWKITKIDAPECLLKDNNEMLAIIKDAFVEEGSSVLRNCAARVYFDYIAEPRFIREVK